jgi:ATP diphosphatase
MNASSASPSHSEIDRLLDIMARLRDPETGCPWDKVQTFETIAPYTIEEAYEVADAIADGDMDELQGELGDLLFQVVFYAQMSLESGGYGFTEIARSISDKMIRRHPHVFAGASIESADAQTAEWETQKRSEREAKAKARGDLPSVLDDVPAALPALARAVKLQKRAARVGFDWPDVSGVLDKLAEEIEELRVEQAAGNTEAMAEELGDVLFAWTNLARHHKIDPETALRSANAKFERRFRRIEALLAAENRRPDDADLEDLEALWNQTKTEERA